MYKNNVTEPLQSSSVRSGCQDGDHVYYTVDPIKAFYSAHAQSPSGGVCP